MDKPSTYQPGANERIQNSWEVGPQRLILSAARFRISVAPPELFQEPQELPQENTGDAVIIEYTQLSFLYRL